MAKLAAVGTKTFFEERMDRYNEALAHGPLTDRLWDAMIVDLVLEACRSSKHALDVLVALVADRRPRSGS